MDWTAISGAAAVVSALVAVVSAIGAFVAARQSKRHEEVAAESAKRIADLEEARDAERKMSSAVAEVRA